jgi:hypothetical protein
LSHLSNAQAEQLCDEALGVTRGSMSDPAWRACLTPLTYRAVCDATVQNYLDCVTHDDCADYEAMCPQVLDAPALPRGMWVLGSLVGDPLDLRWGTYVSAYDSPSNHVPHNDGSYQLTGTFEKSQLYVFGSIPDVHYRGLLAMPSSGGSVDWYCLGETQVGFDDESSWQSGGAVFRDLGATGLSRLGTCDSEVGTPFTLAGPHVDTPTPVCNERWCLAELDTWKTGPDRASLLMVRDGTADETHTSGDTEVRLVHVAESFLVERGGDGSVVCGSGGTISFTTTTEYTAIGSPRVRFSFTVGLDRLARNTPVTCPGTNVEGSLNATVADFE